MYCTVGPLPQSQSKDVATGLESSEHSDEFPSVDIVEMLWDFSLHLELVHIFQHILFASHYIRHPSCYQSGFGGYCKHRHSLEVVVAMLASCIDEQIWGKPIAVHFGRVFVVDIDRDRSWVDFCMYELQKDLNTAVGLDLCIFSLLILSSFYCILLVTKLLFG
jgi:hypothetical protein